MNARIPLLVPLLLGLTSAAVGQRLPAAAAGASQSAPSLAFVRLIGEAAGAPHVAVGGGGNVILAGMTASRRWPSDWTAPCHLPNTGICTHVYVLKMDSQGTHTYYSAVMGGTGGEQVTGLAVDAAGNAYVTGTTGSSDFPAVHALRRYCGGAARRTCSQQSPDGFVVKLDPHGRTVYSTYLGGRGADVPTGIAVGRWGDVYVTGYTLSPDFPIVHAIQRRSGGEEDGFVTRINRSGSRLLYSTYLGGSDNDVPEGIAVAPRGEAFVTGGTLSANFRTSRFAVQPRYIGGQGPFDRAGDGFLVKLGTAGRFLAGTFIGSAGDDRGNAVAVDGSGRPYVAGATTGVLPRSVVMGDRDKPLCGANGDIEACYAAFVYELTPSLNRPIYTDVLSGNGADDAGAIAVDGHGRAVIGGSTESSNFPTVHPTQVTIGGGACPVGKGGSTPCDGFVAAVGPGGISVTFSTYLGGNGDDSVASLALDRQGAAEIAGYTDSTNLATVSGHASTGTFLARINHVFSTE